MELRGLRAGCAAVLVVALGAGMAGASPRGLTPEVVPTRPMAEATPVNALTTDQAVAMLEAEGYVVVDTHRTWLGRIVITAEGKAGTREIVLHPFDGQVLRDVIVEPAEPPVAELPAEAVQEPEAPVAEQAAEVSEDTSPDAGEDDAPELAVLPSAPEDSAP